MAAAAVLGSNRARVEAVAVLEPVGLQVPVARVVQEVFCQETQVAVVI